MIEVKEKYLIIKYHIFTVILRPHTYVKLLIAVL